MYFNQPTSPREAILKTRTFTLSQPRIFDDIDPFTRYACSVGRVWDYYSFSRGSNVSIFRGDRNVFAIKSFSTSYLLTK